MSYDKEHLRNEHQLLLSQLTNEQAHIYNEIMDHVDQNKGGMFLVYGYGGTGKTYLWRTLSAGIRSKGQIVLGIASSGIASSLLTGGSTAHSRFAIPINVHEDSVCSIAPNSDLSQLLKETKLIIWDEAPMIHRHCIEAFERTLSDICINDTDDSVKCFGGKVIVFGGDFRQILPVVQKGSRQDIVNASLNSSQLWAHCKIMRLTINMRLKAGTDRLQKEGIREFANWLLQIGDGLLGGDDDGDGAVEIPQDMLIMNSENPIQSVVDFVYPSFLKQLENQSFFEERAILASTNQIVGEINDYLLDQIPGEPTVYLSSDSLCKTEKSTPMNEALCSPEVLNSMKLSGLPDHELKLKIGVPIMLLRNIDQSLGLCNGTRMRVVNLATRVIEVEIISGNNIGTRTFLPRITMSPSDKRLPFKFNRKQFPVTVCFAMTINKSQGQSLSRVGLFLPRPVFSQGQLYVALSRVTSRQGIKVVIVDEHGNLSKTTKNVVYKEVLQNL